MTTDALRIDDLIVPDWPAPRGVKALMTTRRGGVSAGPYGAPDSGGLNLGLNSGDATDVVASNRRRLADVVGSEPVWLKQVHGARAVDARDAAGRGVEADGSFTTVPGVPCAILVADCAPVLFTDRAGTRVAAAHAGWRGLAAGVLDETLRAGGFAPADTLAWIGPCIGPTRFEVGADVRETFIAIDPAHAVAFVPGVPGKWWADLPTLATMRLHAGGVTDVFTSGACTVLDARRFYSYRRDRVTGRMAALVWIDPRT